MLAKLNNVPLEGDSRPLSTEQVSEWVAHEWLNPEYRFIANVPLVSGLNYQEIQHFDTENWLIDSSDPPAIVVPPRIPCRSGEDGEPCIDCDRHRDGVWKPKHSTQSRRVPLHDSHTHQLIESYAALHGLPLARSTLRGRVEHLNEVSPLDRDVTIKALCHTFGIILAAKGHSDDILRQFLGYSETSHNPRGYRNMADWKRYDGLEAFGTGEFRE